MGLFIPPFFSLVLVIYCLLVWCNTSRLNEGILTNGRCRESVERTAGSAAGEQEEMEMEMEMGGRGDGE